MTAATLHSSLRPRTNLVLAGVWLTALVGVLFFFGRIPWTMVALGSASGVVQGLLQRRALRDGSAQFLEARTALEVRAALTSTAAGRAQIRVLWGSFALYLVLLILQRGDLTALHLMPLLLSAILSQWFVRESITVGACMQLGKAADGEVATSRTSSG
jgi:hypothetical protein